MSFSKINNQTVSKTLSHEKRLFDFIFRQIKDLIDAHAQNCPTVVSESQVDCLIYISKAMLLMLLSRGTRLFSQELLDICSLTSSKFCDSYRFFYELPVV